MSDERKGVDEDERKENNLSWTQVAIDGKKKHINALIKKHNNMSQKSYKKFIMYIRIISKNCTGFSHMFHMNVGYKLNIVTYEQAREFVAYQIYDRKKNEIWCSSNEKYFRICWSRQTTRYY